MPRSAVPVRAEVLTTVLIISRLHCVKNLLGRHDLWNCSQFQVGRVRRLLLRRREPPTGQLKLGQYQCSPSCAREIWLGHHSRREGDRERHCGVQAVMTCGGQVQ